MKRLDWAELAGIIKQSKESQEPCRASDAQMNKTIADALAHWSSDSFDFSLPVRELPYLLYEFFCHIEETEDSVLRATTHYTHTGSRIMQGRRPIEPLLKVLENFGAQGPAAHGRGRGVVTAEMRSIDADIVCRSATYAATTQNVLEDLTQSTLDTSGEDLLKPWEVVWKELDRHIDDSALLPSLFQLALLPFRGVAHVVTGADRTGLRTSSLPAADFADTVSRSFIDLYVATTRTASLATRQSIVTPEGLRGMTRHHRRQYKGQLDQNTSHSVTTELSDAIEHLVQGTKTRANGEIVGVGHCFADGLSERKPAILSLVSQAASEELSSIVKTRWTDFRAEIDRLWGEMRVLAGGARPLDEMV